MIKIKELRKKFGYTQKDLANLLGVSRSTVAMWETSAQNPDYETLKKLTAIFQVSADCMIVGDTNATLSHKYSIPVLGDVAAGIPIEVMTNIIDYEEIDDAMAASGEYFALRIKGQSMEPRIREGDIVIVHKQETANTGDTVVVMVDGNSATVKQIKYGSDGIALIPSNPSYDIQFFPASECEKNRLCIIGRVVELRGKF